MNKIFTPNIFITTRYSVINKFMTESKLSAMKGSEDTLVISSENNRYLQSFKYTNGYENKGTPSLILEFIDVDGNFENLFLNNGVFKQTLDSIMERSIKDGKFIGNYKNSINTVLSSKFKIYFSFGVGDNINSWGGPYVADLIKTEFDMSNNGLRVYRYTFLPSNSFLFRPTLEFDPSNPNQFSDLSFGFNDIKTFSINFTKANNLLDVHQNIKILLRKYISKIANTPEDNVIVVLPKINEAFYNYIVNKKNDITSLKGEGQAAYNRPLGSRLVDYSTIPKLYTSYQEKKERDAFNASGVIVAGANVAEINEGLYPYIVEGYKKLGIDLYLTDPASDDLKNIGDEYRQLTTSGNFINPNSVDISNDGQVKKGKYFDGNGNPLKLSANTSSADDHFILKLEASTENQSSDNKAINIPPWWKKLEELGVGYSNMTEQPRNSISAWQENDLNMLKLFKKHKLIVDETKPCVLVGNVQMILETVYRNQAVTFDNFMGATSNKRPITDFEFEQDDLNPKNSPPAIGPVEKPEIYVGLVVNTPEYITDLYTIKFKHKGNSSFDEKIDVSEFTFKDSPQQDIAFQNAVKDLEKTDIPIFLNNLRNSNVLSISLETQDTYTNAMSVSVANDLSKYIYEEILSSFPQQFKNIFSEKEQKAIKDLYDKYKQYNKKISKQDRENFINGVIPTYNNYDVNKNNNELFVQDLFSEEYQTIDQGYSKDIFDANDKITNMNSVGSFIKSPPIIGSLEDSLSYLPGIAITKWLRDKTVDTVVSNEIDNLLDGLRKNRDDKKSETTKKFNNILTQPNSEDITYLHLMLAQKFRLLKKDGMLTNVDDDALYNLSELVIAMMDLNQSSSSMVSTSRFSGPKKKSMQGKIFDYLYRYNTTLNIKTLPFFHLSNWTCIRRPAYMISRKIKTIGNNSNQGKDTGFDFFTGIYSIVGYKHIINSREMYSEFTLIKNIAEDNDIKQGKDYKK